MLNLRSRDQSRAGAATPDARRAMRRLAPALLLAVEATVFFSEDFSGDCAPLPRRRYPRRAALTAALAAPQGSRAGW